MKSSFSAFVRRLSINQLVMMVCGIVIRGMLVIWFPENYTLHEAAAIFILALSMTGQYQMAWKVGERDRNLVKYNHLTYDSKRGLKAACISFLPSLIGMTVMFFLSGIHTYAVYIAGVAATPLLVWFGYLNGHKLKSYGISIVYRKKR